MTYELRRKGTSIGNNVNQPEATAELSTEDYRITNTKTKQIENAVCLEDADQELNQITVDCLQDFT